MGWRSARLIGGAVFVLVVLGGLATLTARAQHQSRVQLEQRFVLRNTLGASFAASYVRSVVAAERVRAKDALSGRTVTPPQFARAVDALGFEAALLLDRRGRVLHVWPSKPSLVGTEISSRYVHLERALRGRVGVSNVVPSAARAVPVVAFAVPFASPSGRRVFSGAFAIGATPLAAYLNTALPFSGGELSLVDGRGSLIFDNRPGAHALAQLEEVDPALAAAIPRRSLGSYDREGDVRFFARHAIVGTPWHLVVSVPEAQLFAPVNGASRLLPWVLLAALAFAGLSTALLLARLSQHRAHLAEANAKLAERNEELRELDRLKDEFVALVSHELRTPLTSIIGFVSVLQRGKAGVLDAKQRNVLGIVERNAQRLLRLVGDLLVAARADAGKLVLEPEPLDLAALAREAVESARPQAETQDVEVLLETTGSTPLFADRARMLQVLDNLLSNAIKFSSKGGVIRVSVTAEQMQARIRVHDDGIGIPADEQARLFSRFFRATTATSREIGGTGLGLSIVKTIVDLHAGTIAFSSHEGAGSTFTVTLPLSAEQEAAA